MVNAPLQPGAARGTVHGLRLVCDVFYKGSAARVPVQILKSSQPQASIGWNVCHAYLLPAAGSLLTFGHVVSQAQFTRTQKQQSP